MHYEKCTGLVQYHGLQIHGLVCHCRVGQNKVSTRRSVEHVRKRCIVVLHLFAPRGRGFGGVQARPASNPETELLSDIERMHPAFIIVPEPPRRMLCCVLWYISERHQLQKLKNNIVQLHLLYCAISFGNGERASHAKWF